MSYAYKARTYRFTGSYIVGSLITPKHLRPWAKNGSSASTLDVSRFGKIRCHVVTHSIVVTSRFETGPYNSMFFQYEASALKTIVAKRNQFIVVVLCYFRTSNRTPVSRMTGGDTNHEDLGGVTLNRLSGAHVFACWRNFVYWLRCSLCYGFLICSTYKAFRNMSRSIQVNQLVGPRPVWSLKFIT